MPDPRNVIIEEESSIGRVMSDLLAPTAVVRNHLAICPKCGSALTVPASVAPHMTVMLKTYGDGSRRVEYGKRWDSLATIDDILKSEYIGGRVDERFDLCCSSCDYTVGAVDFEGGAL